MVVVHGALDGAWQAEPVRWLLLVQLAECWSTSWSARRAQPALTWLSFAALGGLALWSIPVALADGLNRQANGLARRAERAPGGVRRQGLETEAAVLWTRASLLDPLEPRYPRRLARLAPGADGLDQLVEATRRGPNRPHLWRELSQRRAALGQHVEALAAQRRVLDLEPRHAVDHLVAAERSLAVGDRLGARSLLERAVALEPNYRVAWLALAAGGRAGAERKAQAIAQRIRSRYCAGVAHCNAHIERVMTPLERILLGSFLSGADAPEIARRFGGGAGR
jgi:tetratricopeptide (TPR) repeat protein